MRRFGLLKSLVVIILSLALIASFTTVFAADDANATWDWETEPINEVSTNTANTANTANTNTALDNTNIVENNTTNELTTNLNTNLVEDDENETENEENVNSLAYTGAESNSILAIAVVLGTIVAVYSFKKVREYNSL